MAIVLIIVLIYCIFRKYFKSPKGKACMLNLKRKVFWNGLIRYVLLNTLKFYMASLIVFKKYSGDEGGSISGAIVSLAFMMCLPIFMGYVVH